MAAEQDREGADRVDRVDLVAATLRAHKIEAIVVETGAQARELVLGMIPEGAEVHSGKSKTLEDVGLYAELVESGRYDALRPRYFKMDRKTQGREIRKLIAAPDFMLGSAADDQDHPPRARDVRPELASRGRRGDQDPGVGDGRNPTRTPRFVSGWASTRLSRRSFSFTANG